MASATKAAVPAVPADAQVCTRCGARAVVEDKTVGEVVCRSCGVVSQQGLTGPELRRFTDDGEDRSQHVTAAQAARITVGTRRESGRAGSVSGETAAEIRAAVRGVSAEALRIESQCDALATSLNVTDSLLQRAHQLLSNGAGAAVARGGHKTAPGERAAACGALLLALRLEETSAVTVMDISRVSGVAPLLIQRAADRLVYLQPPTFAAEFALASHAAALKRAMHVATQRLSLSRACSARLEKVVTLALRSQSWARKHAEPIVVGAILWVMACRLDPTSPVAVPAGVASLEVLGDTLGVAASSIRKLSSRLNGCPEVVSCITAAAPQAPPARKEELAAARPAPLMAAPLMAAPLMAVALPTRGAATLGASQAPSSPGRAVAVAAA